MENQWHHHPSDSRNTTKTLQVPAGEIGFTHPWATACVCVFLCVCWCCAYLSHNFCFQQSHKSLGFANPTCDMCITGLFSCHFLVLAVAQYQRWLNYSTSLTADNFGRIPPILNIISATSQGSFLVIHPDLLLIEHHGDTYSYIFLLCH